MRDPHLDDGDVVVYAGDCVEVMRELPEASIDAIITDPPYGLEFMGKEWDAPKNLWRKHTESPSNGDQSEVGSLGNRLGGRAPNAYVAGESFERFSESWAREAFRILKPGGHLLAFAGTRTYHRMASGVEDAGFEIRDCIAWMYGSGFPKSLDVSKAIDKAAGAEREVVGDKLDRPGYHLSGHDGGEAFGHGLSSSTPETRLAAAQITAPATPDAEKWSGWGTALKPAFEPVVVARKPLVGTVAQNVLEHGTGAINVDGCRVAADDDYQKAWDRPVSTNIGAGGRGNYISDGSQHRIDISANRPDGGRWPANVTLDEDAAAMLDDQSGIASPKHGRTAVKGGNKGALGAFAGSSPDALGTWPADPGGGASRFFYTAKASRQDRNVGGLADNTHPTVKPTDLMRWLVRLVTPPGGVVLDPFGGSGSTGLACRAEAVRCILIEREPEYLQIISDRLKQLSLFGGALGE